MRQISTYHQTKEDGFEEELLILQYNLIRKVHKQYQYMSQDGYNTIFWYCPNYYTYELYITDAGKGKQINFGLEFTFMSGYGNLEFLAMVVGPIP